MDLSIIIVSWNVKERLRDNLRAVFASAGNFSREVFVVDNNSSDGSAEMVRQEFPEAILIANSENLGFSRANNLAIARAKGEFILLLNPDMRVFPDTFEKMLTFMKSKPKAAIASCRLLDEEGNNISHVRRFPRLLDQALIVLKIPHLFPSVIDKYLCADFNYDQSSTVDSVRGSFFMIAPRLIKPFLDERYFIWFEEVDLCRQALEQGYEVWYNAEASCLDYIGASFKQVGRSKAQDYFSNSMIKYFAKWKPTWQVCIIKMLWPVGKLLARLLGGVKK